MTDPSKGLAIVTGAGTGLGQAMAVELVRKGVPVAGFGRRPDALAETARMAGPGFHAFTVDVSSTQEVATVVDRLAREIAPVTILINNAAVYPRCDFLDETPESFMHSVAINLGGMVNCSHAALKQMVQAGRGRILNVSTFADLSPLPASSAYAVSKGAARIFTRALLADVGDRFPDIVINDWMPGMLATDMGIAHGLSPQVAARWGVELALWNDVSLNGTIWEQDTELLPPQSLKGRIRDRLIMRSRKPRRLGAGHPG
ncbi:SDR family oxidoreductase [Hydrogenophaga sp.]|uniref:SDR family oxidoreductase n=1 Tax=Hydrogenophaga sp. TaxID=1904254 RepID=UPI003F70A47B